MATYAELLTASQNDTLKQQVRVGVVIAAEVVRTEDPTTASHTARLAWAKSVYTDPEGMSQRMIWAVLAQNQSATLAAILSASDATVQSAINAAVNVFI